MHDKISCVSIRADRTFPCVSGRGDAEHPGGRSVARPGAREAEEDGTVDYRTGAPT